ncbi:MAG: sugar nucleotide-binding protein [Burkholderiaceae bacterium]|nr:sugar nucleotide-binding protein [Burkholderiaceae bacterium]
MSLTPTPRVLILGANGRLGAAAARAFAAAGWSVLAQARRVPALLPHGAQHLAIELTDTEALARAAGGACTVVHAVNPAYTRWGCELLPLARLGLAVAERLRARFMLPGNIYNFGAGMPSSLVEDTPQRPTTAKGRLRCQLEDEMRARAASGLDSVVIRAGDFFGSGTGTWFDQAIVKDLARGKLVYPGPLDLPHAWAYLPDLARAFVAVAAQRSAPAAFRRLHFAGHTLTGAQLLAAIEPAAAVLGLRPAGGWRHGTMPWGLMRTLGLVYPLWRELARMSYLWRVPHQLDGAALQVQVGELPATPLPVALRDALLALGVGRGGPLAAPAL